MMNNNHYIFRNTELDPSLLSTPFKMQTNWHVITGAPSCGKTTMLNQLDDHGFRTVPESARLYIEREMAQGKTIHPIHVDATLLQRGIKEMQLRIESGLQADDVLFLDGAVPGSLAWYRVFGLDPNEILQECFHHRYATVFILDPLPFQPDDQRIEELATITGYLDEWHALDYSALGYSIIRVPVLPRQERLAFVLSKLINL